MAADVTAGHVALQRVAQMIDAGGVDLAHALERGGGIVEVGGGEEGRGVHGRGHGLWPGRVRQRAAGG